jgi:hypothetical protein
MTTLHIKAGPYDFEARMEEEAAPKTCAKFLTLLPYREQIIHVRWSGEGCWIPLGDLDLGLVALVDGHYFRAFEGVRYPRIAAFEDDVHGRHMICAGLRIGTAAHVIEHAVFGEDGPDELTVRHVDAAPVCGLEIAYFLYCREALGLGDGDALMREGH